LNIADDSWPES